MILAVAIWVVIATISLACANDIPDFSPETIQISPTSEAINQTSSPSLVVEGATVKIEISTSEGVYISGGVIVGDGRFAVTYAPGIFDVSTRAEVTHIPSKGVTVGSIIYSDKVFGLALISLTDNLGTPVVVAQSTLSLGEELIIGDFISVEEEDLMVTSHNKVVGFEFDGLVIRFDGNVGSGNVGGPAFNRNGELVGIVGRATADGEHGSLFSPESFKYGLAEKLVKHNKTVIDNALRYELNLIGIPANVIKPSGWNTLSGFGYFDMRSPQPNGNRESASPNGYKVIGIINADSSTVGTSEEVLTRLIIEFGEAFERVPELVIPEQDGFGKCEVLMTVQEYSRTAFERRGYVIPGGWVSHPGIYTGFCSGMGKDQQVIAFAESYDADDIVSEDGLLKRITLIQ